MRLNWLFAGTAVLVLLAPLAWAQGGVVLINQATALRGGLPGCPAQSGYLVSICNPGSYALSGKLNAGAENGIAIETTGVSLNLGGLRSAEVGRMASTLCVGHLAAGRGGRQQRLDFGLCAGDCGWLSGRPFGASSGNA